MARIGVVADTHHPEFLERLPARLFELLRGVDLILHAGDVGGRETLAELSRLAPLEAVRGDHDASLADLPRERVLEVQGRRIALVHGNRSRLLEEPATFIGAVSLGLWWPSPGLHGWLRRRFPDADAIVYGHTHRPAQERRNEALIFNPGGVYQLAPASARDRLVRNPGWFEWSYLQVARHRLRYPAPSVGLLEVGRQGIEARVLPL